MVTSKNALEPNVLVDIFVTLEHLFDEESGSEAGGSRLSLLGNWARRTIWNLSVLNHILVACMFSFACMSICYSLNCSNAEIFAFGGMALVFYVGAIILRILN